MTTEQADVSHPVDALVSRLRQWWAHKKCRWFGHDWLYVAIRGGTVGLIYKRRKCCRCMKPQMMTSRFNWTEPFDLTQSWEIEDRDTGQYVDPHDYSFDMGNAKALEFNGSTSGLCVHG